MTGNTTSGAVRKRGRGRPPKNETRAQRPKRRRRQNVGPLHIENPDPQFAYYWPVDIAENGPNILSAKQDGWEFVTKEDNLTIGEAFEYSTSNIGTIYRVPTSKNVAGTYHFLMKIPKEWLQELYDEDQRLLSERERSLHKPDRKDGQYGYTGYEQIIGAPGLR